MPRNQEMEVKVLTIDSFKGGRANFPDQTIIDPSMCCSGSMNVWAPQGILTKVPGMSLAASLTASGTSTIWGLWSDDSVSTANTVYYAVEVSSTGGTGAIAYLFGSVYSFTDSLNAIGYKNGTAGVTGTTVTGSGTLWSTATGSSGVSSGDRMQFSGDTHWYYISSVTDDTHLTLGAGANITANGVSYVIQHGFGLPMDMQAAALNGKIAFGDISDNLTYYDGSNTFRLAANPSGSAQAPQAAFLQTFNGYLFGANFFRSGTQFPSRIAWSSVNDLTTWPSNNFIDIDLLHNGSISGLKSFGQELIVFKQRGMYKIIGNVFDPSNPTYYVQQINTPPDFIFNSNLSCAIHTFQQPNISYSGSGVNYTNSALLFYAGGYVYQYYQGTNFITRLTDNIILDMPNATVGNPAAYSPRNIPDQQAIGFSYNGFYILTGLLSPNYADPSKSIMLIMDRNKSWWLAHNDGGSGAIGSWIANPFGGWDSSNSAYPTAFALFPSRSAKTQLIMASSGGDAFGRIFSLNLIGPNYTTTFPVPEPTSSTTTPSYSDGAINGIYVSKEFNIEYGTFWKVVLYLKKQSAGNLTFSWSIDQGASSSQTIDMTQGRGTVIRQTIPINQKGSTIQLTIQNNVASQTFGIYAIKIYYTPSDDERIA